MYTALLVDDERRMLELLDLYLSPQGFHCIKLESGSAAIEYLKTSKVDFILLDIMMPELDGWETCKRIREISDVPIIMVTARDQTADIVNGLDIGADDYIAKPFDEEELLARVRAVLRRSAGKNHIIEFQGLVWNEAEHKVYYQKEPMYFTPKEFAILGLLLKSPNRVFSREQIIVALWGYDTDTEERTIDSHVKNIREKLRQISFPVNKFLRTVWGVGYKWEM